MTNFWRDFVNTRRGPLGEFSRWPNCLIARKMLKTNISNILNGDLVFGAFLHNTQLRLIDSNEQSMELANELEKVVGQLQRYFASLDTVLLEQREILEGIQCVVCNIVRLKEGAK